MRQQEQFAATGRVAQADPAGMAAAITGPAALDAQRGKRSVVLLEQVLERAVVEATEVPRVHGQLLGFPRILRVHRWHCSPFSDLASTPGQATPQASRGKALRCARLPRPTSAACPWIFPPSPCLASCSASASPSASRCC
ncbi:hypothetical protein G6F63_014680 [Rhizopus arrhizus]|nr:hypothetical protein G6F63_014680 [Rhizopus arrhizus]